MPPPPGIDDPALVEELRGGAGDDELSVIVRLFDPDVLPKGVRIVTRFGDVATVRVARAQLQELADSPGITALEASRKLRPSYQAGDHRPDDDAEDEGDAASVDPAERSLNTRRPEGVHGTGRGCVVAALDWGVDHGHPAFQHPGGSTRILSLWDQRGVEASGPGNRWGYGRIYTSADIDRALRSDDPYRSLNYNPADAGGLAGAHGTHVLDIAAGSGLGGGAPGVAPEADLVFCHLARTTEVLGEGNLGDSASVLEALDHVFTVAGGRPCVVNMSVGAHGGPHDGSTLVELGIDQAVSLVPGRAVVNSAGNYRTKLAHAMGRVPPNGVKTVRFRVPPHDTNDSEVEVFYQHIDRFTVEVLGPSEQVLARVSPGQDLPMIASGNSVGHVYHRVRHGTSGDHHVDVLLKPDAPGGIWALRLIGDTVLDGRYHAWIERDRGLQPTFVKADVETSSTTGTLCNGRLSVTCGCLDPRQHPPTLAPFSSSGPTRDGRIKPELVAPGYRIRAARSAPPGQAPGARYTVKSGTSMAAPHVAGTIALMFEAAGKPLEITDTRALLFGSVDPNPFFQRQELGPDLHRIGYGQLDIIAAERAARNFGEERRAGERPPAEAMVTQESAQEEDAVADLALDDAPEEPDGFQEASTSTTESWAPVDTGEVQPPKTEEGEAWDDGTAPPAAPRDFREALLELTSGVPVRSADQLYALALSAAERGADAPLIMVGGGTAPFSAVQPGDLLVRAVPPGGRHVSVILSEHPEPAWALHQRGVAVERGGAGLYVEVAEVAPRDGSVCTVARRLTDPSGWIPRGQAVLRPVDDSFGEDDPAGSGPDPDANPLAPWVAERDSLVLIAADGKLFIVPSASIGTIVPPARLKNIDWRQVAVDHELGPLLGLPPVGAGASRVFKAGPRLAVMLDAGRNPQASPAALYVDHLVARVRDLGVSEVRAVILIHRHTDHANELPAVVQRYGVTANNVIMPRAFTAQRPDAAYTATVAALRQVFGADWRPADLTLRPATPSGELVRGRYTLGDVSFEFLGESAALRLRQHTDSASLLTRVTRRGDLNPMVVLGDLRGADLAKFHDLMGPQAWREFFRDVHTIDGFSHHRGALKATDVPGIMRLLEATLLRNGRLTVTLQTDPTRHVEARADTLEFMRRIGIEVKESHAPATAQPSGVRAGTRGATVSGPAAQSHAPIPSALTEAMTRIARLVDARKTIVLWGPHIARSNPAFNQTAELRQIDQSLEALRRAAIEGAQSAATVRTSGTRSAAGRDYTGGTAGTGFTAALARIPATTAAETAIGPSGFAQLTRMQRIPAHQVPLVVALNDALINGRYSREAFRYMVSELDPTVRASIFSGPRGGERGRLKVWERVRAEFGFKQALAGQFSVMSASHLRPLPRAGARGVAGLLALVELGNLVAQGVQSYRISQATAQRKNIAPFLRRIAFWRQLRAQPAAVAVDDGLTGADFQRDPVRIDEGLKSGDWDFLYIEHTPTRPALPDVEVLQAIAVLGHSVRNYDEYATLFVDSGQDALRYVNDGRKPWSQSRWEVRVGQFETSGENHISERWQELPLLTEGMNAIVRRVMANTTELLARIGRGEAADTQELGTLQVPSGSVRYRARLRAGIVKTIVELRVPVPPQWAGRGSTKKIFHEVTWQTTSRPEFFVWEQDGVDLYVTGSNFETYYRLRDLASEEYQVGTRGTMMNALYSRPAGNAEGGGWILTTDIDRI